MTATEHNLIRITLHEGNSVERQAQLIGHELTESGLESLAVGKRSNEDGYTTVLFEADIGPLLSRT